MAQPAALDLVSIEDFLSFEETAPDKHELFHGRLYAMAGGSANHGEIIDSLAGACRHALRGRPFCFVGESHNHRARPLVGLGLLPGWCDRLTPN